MASEERSAKKSAKSPARNQRRKPLNLAKALGADKEAAQCFSIYVPNRDRAGKKVKNHSGWVRFDKQ